MWQLDDVRLAFAVGDVSGKGLPAALVMANLQAALRITMAFCLEPSDIAAHIDRLLNRNLPERMFVTLFLGLFDPSCGRLEYVNAGHIPPLLVQAGGAVSPVGRPRHLPLGAGQGAFGTDRQTVERGSGLVIVTDGVTEARSHSDREFGVDALQRLLESTELASSEGLVRAINVALEGFRGALPQHDDVTVFALINRGTDRVAES